MPIPLAVPLLLIRVGEAAPAPAFLASGVALVSIGEGRRLWAVHHIGVISRTRSDRLGPLVVTGPFAIVRNPLYLGNIAIWVGFAVIARMLWMAPTVVALLGCEYHAIVRWEERLLGLRLGDAYRVYAAVVPRWIPNFAALRAGRQPAPPHRWRDTFFSERGTLVAIAMGFVLLWIKVTIGN
jgi:protein-S-isoprenylcysteine O-methyltransferase Ste14